MKRSEQQDAELVKYLEDVGETQDSDLCCGFLDGWDKADETIIDRACDVLQNKIFVSNDVVLLFRRAMEEELK